MKTDIAIVITYIGAISIAVIAYILAPSSLEIPPILFGIVCGIMFYLISKFIMYRLNKLGSGEK